ncbi:MAG TPA: ceramidase domain-containing protein [Anaerolineae bacterium]|nr:ceramidase domain-containing protein [Anaerolineae bacterium]
MNRIPLWVKLALGILGVAAAMLVLSAAPDFWEGWRPALCWPDCSCEPVRSAGVRTPLNTYTNLAYLLVAAWMWATLPRVPDAEKRWLCQRPGYAAVLAGALAFLGLGSAFFHASLTFAGQWFDTMGMYLLVSFILLYALARWRGLSGKTFGALYAGLNALLGAALFIVPAMRRQIFMGELVVALLLEIGYLVTRRPPVKVGYLIAGLAVFFFSDRLRAWDMVAWACRPESWLQLHPLYHIISAAAIGLLYLYYRSELTTE